MDKRVVLQSIINYCTDGNKTQFANKLGITPSAVTAWMRRGTYDVKLICTKCTDINPTYLLTGEGSMLLTGVSKTETETKTEGKQNTDTVLKDISTVLNQMTELCTKIYELGAKNQEQFDKVLSLFDRVLALQEREAEHHTPCQRIG